MITFLLFSKFAGDDILILIGLIAIAFVGLFIECSVINYIFKIAERLKKKGKKNERKMGRKKENHDYTI